MGKEVFLEFHLLPNTITSYTYTYVPSSGQVKWMWCLKIYLTTTTSDGHNRWRRSFSIIRRAYDVYSKLSLLSSKDVNGNFAAVINGDQRYNLFVTGIGNLLACIACCWTRRM